MAKVRRKKNTDFNASMEKSCFLYGRPNAEKLRIISFANETYTSLVNMNIDLIVSLINEYPETMFAVMYNNNKDSALRKLEKDNRPDGLNSAFCQNAFDEALSRLSMGSAADTIWFCSHGVGVVLSTFLRYLPSEISKGCSAIQLPR